MRAWEIACREGNRVFYESYTDTIRACPENYLLAFRNNGMWSSKGDAATEHYWDKIQKRLDKGGNPEALAKSVSKACPKQTGFDAWQ